MSGADRGRGKGIQWVREHVNYTGEFCLIWPFSRNPETGYALFGFEGQMYYVHRYMCELKNGPPPTPQHEAAHSCGNGHGGCANPNHLSWKTPSENAKDCRAHGTQAKHRNGRRGHLSAADVIQIRALRGRMTQRAIADQFGCSPSTVRDIFTGRSRNNVAA